MKRILLLSVLVTACTPRYAVHVDQATIHAPESLKTPCRLIEALPDTITMGILFEHYSKLVQQYTECRLTNQAKIDWLTSQDQ